jgi:phage terminase large subunit-like protein
LTRHVLNARRKPTSSGIHIAKEHPDSAKKIDAAVAAVLAWRARVDAMAAGVGVKVASFTPRRVY